MGKYYVGLALLDREDPTKVIARTPDPVFSPEMDYEVNDSKRKKCVITFHWFVGNFELARVGNRAT